jgi:hypothetical protein
MTIFPSTLGFEKMGAVGVVVCSQLGLNEYLNMKYSKLKGTVCLPI